MPKNIDEVMDVMLEIKLLAKNADLYASYIPVAGSIEILYKDKHIGISHDGINIILKSGIRENLKRWLKAMILATTISNILLKKQ